MSLKLLALQGPNLNRLGRRDPTTYGSLTLARVQEEMTRHAAEREREQVRTCEFQKASGGRKPC